jgi:hypothetical protein
MIPLSRLLTVGAALFLLGVLPLWSDVALADDARAEGTDMQAWFGVALNIDGRIEPDDELGKFYVFYDPPEVWGVEPGSPAHRAGLRFGDELTHIDGVPIDTDEGGLLFSKIRPAQAVTFTCRREGESFEVTMTAEGRQVGRPAHDWPADEKHLRYAGTLRGTDIEVRGLDGVVVIVNKDREQILIMTADFMVRLQAADGDPR